MRILLDEKESQKWLHLLACEKTLEETSRFPKDMQAIQNLRDLNGVTAKPANWPSQHKEEIMSMVADGKYPREIARILKLNESSVKHLVYAAKKKARQVPVGETLGKDVAIPIGKAESPVDAATSALEARQKQIDDLILAGAKARRSHLHTASEINSVCGGQWMPDDVSRRLADLRGAT